MDANLEKLSGVRQSVWIHHDDSRLYVVDCWPARFL